MKKYHHIKVGNASGRTRTISFGASIKARISYPKSSRKLKKRAKKGKGKGRVVSLLFSPKKYTLAQAKAWVRKHDYSIKETAKAGTTKKRTPKRRHKK